MKKFAKVLSILLLMSLVSVIALAIFIATFDWNRAKPWINEKVSTSIGREFLIDGNLEVRWARSEGLDGRRGWIPRPTITAEKLQIGNPPWAKRQQLAKLDALELSVDVLPLLSHEVVIGQIALRNPVIDLERAADGSNNWTLKSDPEEPSTWKVSLRQLRFAEGTVYVADQPTRIDLRAIVSSLGQPVDLGRIIEKNATTAPGKNTQADQQSATAASGPTPDKAALSGNPTVTGLDRGYGFGIKADGTYKGAKLVGTAKIGGALSLMDSTSPFPLEVDARLGQNHVIAVGSITDPAKIGAIDLRLTLAANSMADLYDLTGVVLPETPRFRTSGHLVGTLVPNAHRFKYDKFVGEVGSSDLSGTLEYNASPPRPKLTGTLHSKRLALADLGPLIGVKPSGKTAPTIASETPVNANDPKDLGAKPGEADAGKTAAATQRALPNTGSRTDRWRIMDADIVFSGASIVRDEALPISDMSTHVIMNDGVLTFDPLKFGVAGGTMIGTIRLDGKGTPLDGKFDIAARHLQLKKLFPTFQPMNTSFGEINGDARLAGRGNSPATLAATANGEVKLLVNDGAISNTLLEEAGLNVANIVAAKLFGDKVVKINCAAADFVVKDGLLDSRFFALDTSDALINVDGNINLATEEMMLDVYPHTKAFRVFSLRSPLYVRGTFKKPDIGVMKGPLIARGAAAVALGVLNPVASLLALLAPSNDQSSPCPEMIQSAREGLKGSPAIKR